MIYTNYLSKSKFYNNFINVTGHGVTVNTAYPVNENQLRQLLNGMSTSSYIKHDSSSVDILIGSLFINENHDGFYLLDTEAGIIIPWSVMRDASYYIEALDIRTDMVVSDIIDTINLNIMDYLYNQCTRGGTSSFVASNTEAHIGDQLIKLGIYPIVPPNDDQWLIIYNEDFDGTGMLYVYRVIYVIDEGVTDNMINYTIYDMKRIYQSGVLFKQIPEIDYALRMEMTKELGYMKLSNSDTDDRWQQWYEQIVPIVSTDYIAGRLIN